MMFVIFLLFIGVCRLLSKHLNDIDVKNSVGVVCKSKSFGDFKIVEYNGCYNVAIEFLETGYRKSCDAKEVKTGSVNEFNKQKHLGLFDNEIDAFRKYKQAKEYQIKNMAEIYKGLVDPRAYEALMNYQVEIDD